MARLFRRQESQLTTDLRSITESGVIDIPKALLDNIVEASSIEESRKEIMVHLRECLKEPSGKKWKRVHAAVVVAEDLLGQGRGAPELVGEIASGLHFDLIQRLAFLEVYQHNESHAQNMIRSKAKALRATLVPKFAHAFDQAPVEAPAKPSPAELQKQDTASTCSTCGFGSGDSIIAPSETSPSHGAAAGPQQAGAQRMLYSLGHFVACGHNDDTTDESSGDEEQKRRKAQRKKASEEKRMQRQRSAERKMEACCLPQLPVPTAAQQMDLLDF